ncbi:MAG: thioredoxin-disulfide reductase [Candidatus Aminicenantes bacterium]|nr:thioredoxin-disulfide reductase [Candidatus Aminicenantes bacterium]
MPDATAPLWDVIIVGAGPAGLAAALYTGRARRRTLVLEKKIPGGQILLTDWVENYPGFPDGVAPLDLTERFRRQAEKFGAEFGSDEVKRLSRTGRTWRLEGVRQAYEARAVIIATGSDYRRLGIPGETRLTGRGVSYCAICDGAFFGGRDIAVVGGGDNALKEALLLAKHARRVTLIHRREKFRGEKVYQERVLAEGKIKVLWETVVEEVLGADEVEAVRLRHLSDGRVSPLETAALFVSIGTEPLTGFVAGLLELNEWGQVKVGPDMRTSQPGIYAAGDVSNACPKQLATAVGTGVLAALAVEEYLTAQS